MFVLPYTSSPELRQKRVGIFYIEWLMSSPLSLGVVCRFQTNRHFLDQTKGRKRKQAIDKTRSRKSVHDHIYHHWSNRETLPAWLYHTAIYNKDCWHVLLHYHLSIVTTYMCRPTTILFRTRRIYVVFVKGKKLESFGSFDVNNSKHVCIYHH